MDATVWGPLAASAITALALWTYNRHRPKVDTSAEQRGWFDQVQEERDKHEARTEKVQARLDAVEETHRQDRMRWDHERRTWQAQHDDQQRQIGAMGAQIDAAVSHIWLIESGLDDGSIPPLPAMPWLLRGHRPRPGDLPPRVVPPFDTGTPGVDPNPPPDDGQDHNPQE